MGRLGSDLHFAWRLLAGRPAFSAVVICTLALGIGVTTATFSLVNGILLEPLPYPEAGRLVVIWEHNIPRDRQTNVASPANFLHWRDEARSFEQMAAVSMTGRASVTSPGQEPEEVRTQLVSGPVFELLGVPFTRGRPFLADEDRPGNTQVIISHRLWQRRFGADASLIGRSITVAGRPREVVGVAPSSLHVLDPDVDVWTPAGFDADARTAGGRFLVVLGRLRPGVTVASASAEMETIAASLREAFPDRQAGWTTNVVPLHEQVAGEARPALLLLLAAVGLVLLIVCGNVANLLLARASDRAPEIGLRVALGAGRAGLVRQMLVESLLLAAVGGALGTLLAWVAVRTVASGVGVDLGLPRLHEVGIDGTVVLLATGATLASAAIAGAGPAATAPRVDLVEALHDGGHRATTTRVGRLRDLFAVSQIAVALVLLVGAGLLIRSVSTLLAVDPGFQAERVLTLQVSLPGARYSEDHQRLTFFETLLARVEALPGVERAGAVSFLPLNGLGAATSFTVVGAPEPPPGERPVADVRHVSHHYFEALGIPLRQGRLFEAGDGERQVIIINETMARELWPGADPIGQRVRINWNDPVADEVVGVVGDVRHAGLDTAARAMVYWPHARTAFSFMTVVVRTPADPMSVASAVAAEVRRLDPEQPVADVRPMTELVLTSVAQRRATMQLLGAFAGLALGLAALGLYGTLSYEVSRRRREMGVRLALGARPASVRWLVLRQASHRVLAGLAIGGAGAFAVTRLMEAQLFDVSPGDPTAFGLSAGALLLAAWLAADLPARRATRTDPVSALRAD